MMRKASSSFSSILSKVPELAKGVLNHSSNDLTELKILDRTKLKRQYFGEFVLKRSTGKGKTASR
jgi:hypothetical protein